jgi:hypothetical protein
MYRYGPAVISRVLERTSGVILRILRLFISQTAQAAYRNPNSKSTTKTGFPGKRGVVIKI